MQKPKQHTKQPLVLKQDQRLRQLAEKELEKVTGGWGVPKTPDL